MGCRIAPLVMGRMMQGQQWSFEPMQPADLDAVMEIERCSFAEPWTPGLFLRELKLPFSTTLVARGYDGRIAGYVCWWTVGDEVHLLNLAVHPEQRRRGLGRQLLALLLRTAEQGGARLVTLEVRHDNLPAIALYEAHGFRQVGLRRNYYAPGRHAVLMEKRNQSASLEGHPKLQG